MSTNTVLLLAVAGAIGFAIYNAQSRAATPAPTPQAQGRGFGFNLGFNYAK